jgi:hypothetical protein
VQIVTGFAQSLTLPMGIWNNDLTPSASDLVARVDNYYGVFASNRSVVSVCGLASCLTSVLHGCKYHHMSTRRPRVLTLSAKESLILHLLSSGDRMYGLQLVAASRRRLKRGTVYVTLGRMEEKGYITSHLEGPPSKAGGLPRRMYQPTALGLRVLTAWTSGASVLIPELAQ